MDYQRRKAFEGMGCGMLKARHAHLLIETARMEPFMGGLWAAQREQEAADLATVIAEKEARRVVAEEPAKEAAPAPVSMADKMARVRAAKGRVKGAS